MVIQVPTYPKDIIKAYILCLNPLLKLKPREIELLDAMLRVYFNLKRAAKAGQMKFEDIDARLNDPMGRKVIRDLINMSEHSHNNHYLQLKKKKVITPSGNIEPSLKNLDTGDLTIQYKFNLIKTKPVPTHAVETKVA